MYEIVLALECIHEKNCVFNNLIPNKILVRIKDKTAFIRMNVIIGYFFFFVLLYILITY
jgi:hypothetical protein